MSTVLIKEKAKWNLQELIPVILFLSIGGLGLFLGLTEVFTTEGSYITAGFGFGITLLILRTSFVRKRRSTLFAKLANDENFNIEVWMRKPIKDKWQGKLDEGKNKGPLVDIKLIKMDTIRGTRIVSLYFAHGTRKPLIIPTRIAQTDALRNYLAQAVEKIGGKVKFEAEEHAREFKALLTGDETYFIPTVLKDYEKVGKEAKPQASPTAVEEKPERAFNDTKHKVKPKDSIVSSTSSTSIDAASENSKGQRRLGYGAYKKPAQVKPFNSIATATAALAEDKEESPEAYHSHDDFLGGVFNGTTSSVKIDLSNPSDESSNK